MENDKATTSPGREHGAGAAGGVFWHHYALQWQSAYAIVQVSTDRGEHWTTLGYFLQHTDELGAPGVRPEQLSEPELPVALQRLGDASDGWWIDESSRSCLHALADPAASSSRPPSRW